MAVLNCCSAPTGLKIAILWWCTGDCWENSCPTPPHLLHPYFPLSGAISTITLGSAPQKCRRLHPITQNSWHEWVFPHAQSGKEGGCQHATALLQLYFSWIFISEAKEQRVMPSSWDSTKGFCSTWAYTCSTTAVRNTPMPCAHTDAGIISRWLCSSFQSARLFSAAGLVFGSFISHKGEQLCQCKGDLARHSSSAKARNDQSAWHLFLYNTSTVKNHWSTSTSPPEKTILKQRIIGLVPIQVVDQQCHAIYLQIMLVNKHWLFGEDNWPRMFSWSRLKKYK